MPVSASLAASSLPASGVRVLDPSTFDSLASTLVTLSVDLYPLLAEGSAESRRNTSSWRCSPRSAFPDGHEPWRHLMDGEGKRQGKPCRGVSYLKVPARQAPAPSASSPPAKRWTSSRSTP